MAVPNAVQRNIDEAEELQRTIYADPADPVQTEIDANLPADPADPDGDEPQKPAAPAAPVVAQVDPAQAVEYWKTRFETLQGKYNAEVPRLQTQLRSTNDEIVRLRDEFAASQSPKPAPTTDGNDNALVTQKDVDDFGQDLIDAMTRVARNEARRAYSEERAALDQKFGAVEQRVGEVATTVAQSDNDKFWGRVIELLPDWSVVDADPAWVAWLDTAPEYSEVTYRDLAGQAIAKRKPEKIVKMVETWRRESSPAPATPQPAPRAPQAPSSPELARQVAPSTVKGNAPSTPGDKRVLTRSEYENLYDVRNVQRYGDVEANRMIAEADAAVAENRVRWT